MVLKSKLRMYKNIAIDFKNIVINIKKFNKSRQDKRLHLHLMQ